MSESSSSSAIPRPPLEIHSPNVAASSISSRNNGKCSHGLLLLDKSPCRAPRMPSADDGCDENENEDDRRIRLSPVVGRGALDFSAVAAVADVSAILGAPPTSNCDEGDDAAMDSSFPDAGSVMMDSSFPDNVDAMMDSSFPNDGDDFEVRAVGDDDEVAEDEQQPNGGEAHETEDERTMREMEESEALARRLMAEEAMASYAASADYLRDNADQFSGEDLAALQAAMAEEEEYRGPNDRESDFGYEDDDDDFVDDNPDGELSAEMMSYDALLRLGERIGSVKEERWAPVARRAIEERCPVLIFTEGGVAEGKGPESTDVKCQVCQYPYEEGERLRRLPCGHAFHAECVERWLEAKDACAFCRKSIVDGDVDGE